MQIICNESVFPKGFTKCSWAHVVTSFGHAIQMGVNPSLACEQLSLSSIIPNHDTVSCFQLTWLNCGMVLKGVFEHVQTSTVCFIHISHSVPVNCFGIGVVFLSVIMANKGIKNGMLFLVKQMFHYNFTIRYVLTDMNHDINTEYYSVTLTQ